MKFIRYLFFLFLFASNFVVAKNIAVPNFELLDLTLKLSDPEKAAEINAKEQRNIEMIETLIQEGIIKNKKFTFIPVSAKFRNKADLSVGYLFDCAKCSADLGREYNADYIVIGRLHKPTYLFSYIIVRVFDVKENRLFKEYRSEIKGMPSKSIPGAVENLLVKINKDIPMN